MNELQPDWTDELNKAENAIKDDFDSAFHYCDRECFANIIKRWMDALENHDSWSLIGRLME